MCSPVYILHTKNILKLIRQFIVCCSKNKEEENLQMKNLKWSIFQSDSIPVSAVKYALSHRLQKPFACNWILPIWRRAAAWAPPKSSMDESGGP